MNKDFKNFLITENDTISSCSLKMNKNNSSFLIVVNQKQLLLGTFSMGDLRNALFTKKLLLETKVVLIQVFTKLISSSFKNGL